MIHSNNIRRALPKDADIIAELIYKTEDYPNEEWGKGSKDEHLARVKSLIAKKDNRFSFENIIVLEEENKVIGMALYIKGNKLKELTLKADRLLIPMQNSFSNKIFITALGIYYYFDRECKKDELYLSNIVLSEEKRGKGLSNILMDEIFKIAKNEGFTKVSLRANNESLIKFYSGLGFKVIKDDKMIKNI